MTLNFLQNDLDTNVRQYVVAATGLSGEVVIPGNDNAPSPNGTYGTVLLVNKFNDGMAGKKVTNVGGNTVSVETSNIINYNYLIQFYRSVGAVDVQDLAEQLRIFYGTPAGELKLEELGLGLFNWSDVTLIDEIIDSEYERRASISLTFRQKLIDTNDVESVKTVPFNTVIEEDF